jgi:hypothetical protein
MGYKVESTYGTASTATYAPLRITGESLHQETSTITSAELRADRQIADVVRSNLSVAGDTSWELSYNNTDLLEAALMSDTTWAGADTATGAVVVNASAKTFTLTAAFSDFVAGQWVKCSGFAEAANNGYFKISVATDDAITVDTSSTLVNETGSGAVCKQGDQILNGTTGTEAGGGKSFTLVRHYEDIGTGNSGFEAIYTGCMVDTMSLAVTTEAVVTGGFGWLGAIGGSNTTSTPYSISDANLNDVMNSIDNVNSMMEGSDYTPTNITAFSFSLANNLRPRLQVGSLGAVSIGSGTVNVSGSFQRYYADSAILDKYLNFTDTNLAIAFEDVDGNSFVFEFPKVVFTSAQRVAGGQNQDIIADVSWEAMMDDEELKTIRITKWSA